MVSLTTVFTPAPSCLTDHYVDIAPSQAYIVGPGSKSDYMSCMPPGWGQGSDNYFSPGVCPSGYVTACAAFRTMENNEVETAVTCCPSGYVCLTAKEEFFPWWKTYSCTSPVTAGQLFTTVPMFSNGASVGLKTLNGAAGGANAFSVQVRFRSSDVPRLPKETGTVNVEEAAPRGLQGPVKLGIGVVVAVVPLILLGAFLLYRRRRKRRQPPVLPVAPARRTSKPELDAEAETAIRYGPYEIPTHDQPGTRPHEAGDTRVIGSELPGANTAVVELDYGSPRTELDCRTEPYRSELPCKIAGTQIVEVEKHA